MEDNELADLLSECVRHKTSPTRVLPGTVVELKLEDDDQSSWVLLCGGEADSSDRRETERSKGAARFQHLTIGNNIVTHITRCCDLAVAILNLEVGKEFTYRSHGELLGGRILSII